MVHVQFTKKSNRSIAGKLGASRTAYELKLRKKLSINEKERKKRLTKRKERNDLDIFIHITPKINMK